MNEKPLVLVVEDNPDHRFIMNWSYEKSNQQCRLLFAEDAEQALLYLEDVNPSFMVLDYELPGENGFELLDRLRTSRQWKHLPVVMFSHWENEAFIKEAYTSGVNAFVIKPQNRKEYINVWNTVFDFWNSHNQLPKAQKPPRYS